MARHDPGLTQALLLSTCGILMVIVSLIGLGPIVDEFVVLGGSLEMSAWGQQLMPETMIYAEWFYLVIRILGVMYLIWPFIYLFRRHRYRDLGPEEDELWG